MKAYRVMGAFQMGRRKTTFTLETIGKDDADAKDRVLSTIGSRHRVDRHHIKLTAIQEVSKDKITDPATEKRLALGR